MGAHEQAEVVEETGERMRSEFRSDMADGRAQAGLQDDLRISERKWRRDQAGGGEVPAVGNGSEVVWRRVGSSGWEQVQSGKQHSAELHKEEACEVDCEGTSANRKISKGNGRSR